MQKRSLLLLPTLLWMALPATPAVIDSGVWYSLTVSTGINADPGANSDPAGAFFSPGLGPWTFNLISAGTLEVVDADLNGDYISVRDGVTPFLPNPQGPVFNGSNCGTPTECLANANFWRLSVALAPKAYSLTFVGIDVLNITTTAFFRVTGTVDNVVPPPPTEPPPTPNAIPEPSTYALTGTAFAALAWLKSRKR